MSRVLGTVGEGGVFDREPRTHSIADAALREFVDKGYYGARVRAIARNANSAVGTLYQYFPSKRHLVTHVYGQIRAHFDDHVAERSEGHAEFREAFRGLWERLAEYFRQYPVALAFMERHHHAPYLLPPEVSRDPSLLSCARSLFEAGVAEGHLKQVRPELLEAIVWGAFWGLAKRCWLLGEPFATSLVAEAEVAAWEAIRRTPPPVTFLSPEDSQASSVGVPSIREHREPGEVTDTSSSAAGVCRRESTSASAPEQRLDTGSSSNTPGEEVLETIATAPPEAADDEVSVTRAPSQGCGTTPQPRIGGLVRPSPEVTAAAITALWRAAPRRLLLLSRNRIEHGPGGRCAAVTSGEAPTCPHIGTHFHLTRFSTNVPTQAPEYVTSWNPFGFNPMFPPLQGQQLEIFNEHYGWDDDSEHADEYVKEWDWRYQRDEQEKKARAARQDVEAEPSSVVPAQRPAPPGSPRSVGGGGPPHRASSEGVMPRRRAPHAGSRNGSVARKPGRLPGSDDEPPDG